MVILLGMPIIQIILFGFAITNEVKNSKVAVYVPSEDIATQQIINRLDASEYFDVVKYLQTPSQIDNAFKDGNS